MSVQTAGPEAAPFIDDDPFPPQAQSITFGIDLPSSFLDTLKGLAGGWVGSRGHRHGCMIALFSDDWTSVLPPRHYVLDAVVDEADLGGVALLGLERSEGYAFVTAADEEFTPLPEAGSLPIPTVRIARLHVP